LTDLKVEANTLEDVQLSLARAKKDIVTYSDIEQVVKSVIPQEKDQARTVREIVKIADDSDISIASLSFPTSTLGNSTAGSTPAPGSTAASAATTSNTQTKKVDGINNVERLEITVTSSKPVTYDRFIYFLSRLEQNRRTSQVSSINITPLIDPAAYRTDTLTFSMVLNVYIKK
jgi:biopolymer transport protein ExbD